MEEKKSNFQLIVVIIFLAAALFAVFVFSGTINIGKQKQSESLKGSLTVWGTYDDDLMEPIFRTFNNTYSDLTLDYVQKSENIFDEELLDAIAEGSGPDIFFLSDEMAFNYMNKLYKIQYANYPVANFSNLFSSAGGVFMTNQGILALPLSVDPLMMYYNKGLLDSAGVVYPPSYWSEFTDLVPSLTKQEEGGTEITQSAVALGQYANVYNAKDILVSLFMQAGSPISKQSGSIYRSALLDTSASSDSDKLLGAILSFYTAFADPANELYSWNRSFGLSSDEFVASRSALYFGFGSELYSISDKNPNLNFAVAPIPQIENSTVKSTKGRVVGAGVSLFSKNVNLANTVVSILVNSDFASDFAKATGTVPARRDLLSTPPSDLYSPVLYSSALYSKSWLDPAPTASDSVFKSMVEDVLSNSASAEQSVVNASSKLDFLLLR